MLQMTVNRLRGLIPIERIFIVTGSKYASLVKAQIEDIPERNIIMEPASKNTAPCIALSALIIDRYYKDAIVTIGIKPTRAETGYGYIKYNKESEKSNQQGIYTVEKFVEKPNIDKAMLYIKEWKKRGLF